MSKKDKNYFQIRLSFNLDEKEDMEVFQHFIEDRKKPSKNIILALYNQLNTESIIINRLDHLEFLLKNIDSVEIKQFQDVKNDLKINLDFDNISLDDFDFID